MDRIRLELDLMDIVTLAHAAENRGDEMARLGVPTVASGYHRAAAALRQAAGISARKESV